LTSKLAPAAVDSGGDNPTKRRVRTCPRHVGARSRSPGKEVVSNSSPSC